MDQVSIKYTNIFHCKTLQNLPKFGFLVCKQTIWQPWFAPQPGQPLEKNTHHFALTYLTRADPEPWNKWTTPIECMLLN
jgi:hypothetical protein